MGRKKVKPVLNQNNVVETKKEEIIPEQIKEKEVVEQEIHIKEISKEEKLDTPNDLSDLENDDQPQYEISEQEENSKDIIPEPIVQQILEYYPEKNDEDNVEEEKPERTLQSLSKAELRFYQRTGIMPK